MVHPLQLNQKNNDGFTPLDFLCFKLQHYLCQVMPYVQLEKEEKPIVHTEDNKKNPVYQLIWNTIKENKAILNTEETSCSSISTVENIQQHTLATQSISHDPTEKEQKVARILISLNQPPSYDLLQISIPRNVIDDSSLSKRRCTYNIMHQT